MEETFLPEWRVESPLTQVCMVVFLEGTQTTEASFVFVFQVYAYIVLRTFNTLKNTITHVNDID